MVIRTSPEFENRLSAYPDIAKVKIENLRRLVLETADKTDGVDLLEETLKWGEPSYVTKKGSTFRMDWKEKTPDQYAMYFQCTSKLVDTFKLIFGAKFKYEGHRAIVFSMDEEIPETELQECITMALTYHKVKHLPMLGY